MSQYFPKPFRNFGRNINLKVNLSNYATKILSIFENCKNYLVRVILPQFYFHGSFS